MELKQISPQTIRDTLTKMGVTCFVHVPDREYDCPTKSWLLEKEYWKWFRDKQYKLGVQTFVNECNDCDDYSSRYRVGAQILNTRRVWKNVLKQMVGMVTQPLPIAVGEVWYKQNAGGGHAINCAFIGSRPDFVFIEPQTQKIVELSNSEIRSIFFVRF
jgi:hypothetical protein